MKSDQRERFNPASERIKYKYRVHIRRVKKKDEKTIIAILKHLRDYELFIGFANFASFNDAVADKYIESLFARDLSLSYINDNVRTLREFLAWLERQRGYRSKLNYNHIEYLNISDNQRRTARAAEYRKAYAFHQIIATVRKMPEGTITERRNKAMVSLQALCGLRVSEIRTMKLKNLIEDNGKYFVYVNPKDMAVKYAKTRHADFMQLPDDIKQNVLSWRDYLIARGFAPKDPFFPQINSAFNQRSLLESTISHSEIQSTTTIRGIFERAFKAAGHEYIRPHSFRHTIARAAERGSPEFFNAVRQALGHSSASTTFQSYGALSEQEQRNRIAKAELDFSR